jgi:hypothetical protein
VSNPIVLPNYAMNAPETGGVIGCRNLYSAHPSQQGDDGFDIHHLISVPP